MNVTSVEQKRPYANMQNPNRELTNEQKKAWYDTMYDADGKMKIKNDKTEPSKNTDPGVQDVSNAPIKIGVGYTVQKVGDEYVVFTLNPAIYFGQQKELTAEQREYLQSTYDMDNLSKEERIKLLADLSCFGIISAGEAYQEAFPEKCPWLTDEQKRLGFDGTSQNSGDWLRYYQAMASSAKESMKKIIASNPSSIAYVEGERRTMDFYSSLCQIMNQISTK